MVNRRAERREKSHTTQPRSAQSGRGFLMGRNAAARYPRQNADGRRRGHRMRRRDLLALLGGFGAGAAVIVWPPAVQAQRPERVRSIGVLMPLAATDSDGQARVAALLQGLRQLG